MPAFHRLSIFINSEEVIIIVCYLLSIASTSSAINRAFLFLDDMFHLAYSFIKFLGEEFGADAGSYTLVKRFLLKHSEAVGYADQHELTAIDLEQNEDLMAHHEQRTSKIIFDPHISIIAY